MVQPFVITISIAFSIFIITTLIVFVVRKSKAKRNVGRVCNGNAPGQTSYPPAYGQQVVYAPGQQFQNSTGYPYAPGQSHQGYPPQYGYATQPGYPAQPCYTVQSSYPGPPGYPGQPGYPAPPGYPAQSGYPAYTTTGVAIIPSQPSGVVVTSAAATTVVTEQRTS